MPPPPEVLHALGLTSWPDDPDERGGATKSLRVRDPGLWLDLVVWAHGEVGPLPALDAWAALLGVSTHTLKHWRLPGDRSHIPEVAALPVRPGGRQPTGGRRGGGSAPPDPG